MVGRVRVDAGVRRRAAAAALIEGDQAKALGVEEAPMRRREAGPRTAMQEQDGRAVGGAAFLPSQAVAVPDVEDAAGVRFAGRIEVHKAAAAIDDDAVVVTSAARRLRRKRRAPRGRLITDLS